MKSEWKVTSQVIGDRRMYAVYRLLDVNEVDHSGNREFATDYLRDRANAEIAARELNEKEVQFNDGMDS